MSKPQKHKRNKRGYIQLNVRYRDPITGTAHSKTLYGKTEQEAAEKKAAFLALIDSGLRDSSITVKQWSVDWLRLYKSSVTPSTLTGYQCDINLVNAVIGSIQLKSLTQAHIMEVYTSIRGMSASTINKTRSLLQSMLDAAVANMLMRSNPSRGVKAPKGYTMKRTPLSMEQIQAVLEVAQTHRFAPVILLMLFCGLRRGEACAVHASDIQGNALYITKSVRWVNNRPTLVSTKTKAGIRVVPIPSLIVIYLRFEGYAAGDELPTLQAFKRAYSSFMCKLGDNLNGFTKRWAGDRKYIAPSIRPHDLRHTYATLLYDAGVDIKTAQQWLGHASPSLTMSLYTHLTESRKSISADKLETFVQANVQPKVQPNLIAQPSLPPAPTKEESPKPNDFNDSAGTPGAIRTRDPSLRRRVLYPLSYGSISPARARRLERAVL